jgi:hypothetical protein
MPAFANAVGVNDLVLTATDSLAGRCVVAP